MNNSNAPLKIMTMLQYNILTNACIQKLTIPVPVSMVTVTLNGSCFRIMVSAVFQCGLSSKKCILQIIVEVTLVDSSEAYSVT